jgi:hypothetical protein
MTDRKGDTMTSKRRPPFNDDPELMTDTTPAHPRPAALPSVERVQQELATATSLDDFFGKEGIFARLFATTLEQMLEAELTEHLGYAPYAAAGRNSCNSRNGKRPRHVRSSGGDLTIQVPRDRKRACATLPRTTTSAGSSPRSKPPVG